MWDGGLQEQEVLAIEKIKAAFSANVSKPDKPVRGGSIGEQLHDKHNVLQEDRGIGKCMINRILWAVMN